MLIRRAINQFKKQEWSSLFAELVIVVVGIIIAIQADNWWRHQDDLQQEHLFIARLTGDVERDVTSIKFSIKLAEYRLSLANVLIAAAKDPQGVLDHPAMFITAIHQASFTNTPTLNNDTFEELRSTGGLSLLRSDELKAALFEYYRYDKMMRQYLSLQLMTEFRHLKLVAGVLTNDQYVWMQDEMGYVSPTTKSNVKFNEQQLEQLLESATRLQASDDIVAWLPEIRSMQIELQDTHQRRQKHAEALLVILKDSD